MFPWASSAGSDFDPDFNVYFTEAQQGGGGSTTTTGARSRRPSRSPGKDVTNWEKRGGGMSSRRSRPPTGTDV